LLPERSLACEAMAPQVNAFYDERSKTLSYIVHGGHGTACAVIDPVLDFDPVSGHTDFGTVERLVEFIGSLDLTVEWILETHIHHDHLSGAHALREKVGGQLGIGEHFTQVADIIRHGYNLPPDVCSGVFDHMFRDDEVFSVGGYAARVVYTPGHTVDSVSYMIGDAVFVGDALFMPDFGTGRCNFHGGDARVLYRSIQRLLALAPQTRMFVCHDYCPGGRSAAWETTVADQKASNIHVHDGVTEEEFVELRNQRDRTLGAPLLLLPCLQVNIRGGRLPSPEGNGIVYLKIPVDMPPGAV